MGSRSRSSEVTPIHRWLAKMSHRSDGGEFHKPARTTQQFVIACFMGSRECRQQTLKLKIYQRTLVQYGRVQVPRRKIALLEFCRTSASTMCKMADGYTDWKELYLRLVTSSPARETERCWNWKHETLDIAGTLAARGWSYNGYPVSADYFGSYSWPSCSDWRLRKEDHQRK